MSEDDYARVEREAIQAESGVITPVSRVLRPYQARVEEQIRQAAASGYRRILLQLATGAGKSVIFSKLIRRGHEKRTNVLFLVHRRELIHQASEHLKCEGVEHGIILAGHPPSLMANVQLASVSTLFSRGLSARKRADFVMPPAKLIIVDEAHHVGARMYNEILAAYPEAFIIGVTATPVRQSGKMLGDCFDVLIQGPSVAELMNDGYLCRASYMVPFVPDLTGVHVQSGDYAIGELEDAMDKAVLVGDVVEHYVKYAAERRAIVFAVGVKHSQHLVEEFERVGISAAHIDGSTPIEVRDAVVADFENGKYRVLSNCQVFTEGVDCPAVDAIILARPTKSLGLYLQMVGRGLRPKPNGGDCLMLDHSGNVLRHGLIDDERQWALEEGGAMEERQIKQREANERKDAYKQLVCDDCGCLFEKRSSCPKCGWVVPVKGGKTIQMRRGELVPMPRYEPKGKPPSPERKQEWYSMALSYARGKGYKDGWAAHLYRDKFGVWPRGLARKPAAQLSVEFRKFIQYRAIRRAKSKHGQDERPPWQQEYPGLNHE